MGSTYSSTPETARGLRVAVSVAVTVFALIAALLAPATAANAAVEADKPARLPTSDSQTAAASGGLRLAQASGEPPLEVLDPGLAGDLVGSSVATWEDKLIVGAPGANGGSGTAFVYGRSPGGDWQLEADLGSLTALTPAEAMGSSVAVAGADNDESYLAAVGSPGSNTVRLFQWTLATGWTLAREIVRSGPDVAFFGHDVDVQRVQIGFRAGTFQLAVGAPGNETIPGRIAAYRWDGTTLTLDSDTTCPSCSLAVDRFGEAVAVDGDLLVVGAPGDDSAWVYERDADFNWAFTAELNDPSGIVDANFGAAVDVDQIVGGVIVVGAPLAALEPALAPIIQYRRNGSAWDSGTYHSAPAAGTAGLGEHLSYQDGLTISGDELWTGITPVNSPLEFGGHAAEISDSGDIVVGAPNADGAAGAQAGLAYTYYWPDDVGSQVLPGTFLRDFRDHARLSTGRDGVDIEGDRAIAGASFDAAGAGTAFVLERSGSTWVVADELDNPSPANGEFFGTAVAINDTYAVVTEPTAGIHWWVATTGSWTYQGLISPPTPRFLNSIDLDGDRFAVAAQPSGGMHEVFVYTLDGGSGTAALTTVPVPSDQTTKGSALVKLDGSDLFVAVDRHPTTGPETSNNGRVYVFNETSADTWSQIQTIDDPVSGANSLFGADVDLDNGRALVGALRGGAHLFERDAATGQWTYTSSFTPTYGSGAAVNSVRAVGLDGPLAVVSSSTEQFEGLQTGVASVFVGAGASWTETDFLTPVDPENDQRFGQTLSLDGTTVLVGSPFDNSLRGVDSGAIYPFELSAPSPPVVTINAPTDGAILPADGGATADFSCTTSTGDPLSCAADLDGTAVASGDPIDSEQGSRTLTVSATDGALTTEETASFTVLPEIPEGLINPEAPGGASAGTSVSAYGDLLAVGAPGENTDTGAVYLFRRTDGAYVLVARIDAEANAQSDARFGTAVDLHQRIGNGAIYLVVGAPGETVGGLDDAGALYIYRVRTTGITLVGRGDAGAEAQAGARLGTAVGIAGRNNALAGAPGHDLAVPDAGLLFSFSLSDASLARSLSAGADADAGIVTGFGAALDTAGDSGVVGAPGGEGAAYQLGTGGNIWRVQGRYPGPVNVAFGTSVARWGGVTAVGAPKDLSGAGTVRLFEASIGSGSVETAVLGGGLADAGLGTSVDVMDGIAVSGDETGRAWAFSRIDGSWTTDRELQSAFPIADAFGADVAIEGTNIFVGHPSADVGAVGNEGVVERFAGTYDEQPGRLTADDGDPFDNFGTAVANDGATALVAAPGFEDDIAGSGKVYVYDLTGAEPVTLPPLEASDASTGDRFGLDVAVSGNLALVGASARDAGVPDSGTVYVFFDSGAGFDEIATIVAPTPTRSALFGRALHLEELDGGGWLAVIGAPGDAAGKAFVYLIDPSAPAISTLAATLDGVAAGDRFGWSVAADGLGKVIVGAPGVDTDFSGAGAAYVFTTTDTTAPASYALLQEVTSPLQGENYNFGFDVDIDGSYLAVGAVQEDDRGGNFAGAGYGFALVGDEYVDQVRVATQQGTVGGNRWGSAVALEGDLLVVAVSGQDDQRLLGRALLRDGSTWTPSEEILYSGAIFAGSAGADLALAADGTIVAGAPSAESRSGLRGGAAYVTSVVVPEPPSTTITIGRPADGGVYVVGEPTSALFACIDGSGAATDCTATLDGTPLNLGDSITDQTGTFTFTVSSGAVSESVTFTVIEPPETDVTVSYTLSSSSVPVGVTAVPLDNAAAAEIAGEDTDISGVSAASLGTVDFDQPPTNTEATTNPLGDVTLGQLGLDTLGPAAQLLSTIPLTEFSVDGGWEQYLVGSIYQDVPLQAVTLGDVYSLSSVASIPIRFSDVAASPIRFSDIATVAFAGLPVLAIDLDGDSATPPLAEWCAAAAAQELTCADLGLSTAEADATLGALAVAGFDISASPIRFSPIRFSYIEASPIRFSPIRFSDIEASPIRFSPIRFSPIRFSELRDVPIRFSPIRFSLIVDIPADSRAAIVNCALADCSDSSTQTIDDAARLGAYIGTTATFADLGDVILGDLRVEDILAYLDDDVLEQMEQNWENSDLTLGDLDLAGGVGDLTLGDLEPGVWEAIEDAIGGGYVLTVEELFRWFDFENPDFPDITIGDFLLLFLPRDSYAWEQVDVASLGLQTAGTSPPVTSTIDFRVDGILERSNATVTLVLPNSAVLDPGSLTASADDVVIDNLDVTSDQFVSFDLIGVEPSVDYQITFGVFAGVDLGTSETIAEISIAGATEFATSALTVTEAFEPGNNSPGGAVGIAEDTLYLSHVSTATDVDFYRLTVPNPDTKVSVILSNLPADYDLVVYGPEASPIVPGSGEVVETVPDPDFDVNPANDETAPAPLDDIPVTVPGFEVYGVSYNRDTRDDQVDILAAAPGDYLLQVTKGSTLGAEADQNKPYALRAATTTGTSLPCPARTFPSTGATGTSSPISAATNTLFVVNQQRLGSLYGPAAAQQVMDKLAALQSAVNTDPDDGVEAAILAVDSIGPVQAAYSTWDQSPCEIDAMNAVVGSIAAQIRSIRETNDIDHIMIVGGDDIVPFGRVDDATRIANEQSYASSLGGQNNALRASLSASQILTDDPYGDRFPAQADNREVFVTEVALGRLVEGPAEIIANIDLYLASGGALDPQTGFVAGYDFLDDGSEAVADTLDADLASSVDRLINNTWRDVDLADGLAAGADVNSIAAHFDHYRALPAIADFNGVETDLYEVDRLAGTGYSGAIVFSMGCHSGLSVSDDAFSGLDVEAQDWAQTFLAEGASVYVASTGYAYGDDVAVALTEKLLGLFAEGLGDYATVGEALLYAKQEYAADLTAYGVYDEKALMEATMYGIPFFSLANEPLEITINEPTLSDSPFGPFANLAVSPDLQLAASDSENTYWFTPDEDGGEQVQVTSGYPILPTVEIEVTQQVDGNPDELELDARGVMFEALTTVDVADVDAATARAVYDLAEHEPNTDSAEVTFALAPAVTTFLSPAGIEQQVTMTVGAFESTSPDGIGTMRLYEEFDLSVYYASPTNSDTSNPVFRNVESDLSGSTLTIEAEVTDDSGVERVTALVTSTPSPGTNTVWQHVELSPSGGVWSGSASVGAGEAEFLLQALDGAGNVGTSLNKKLSFGTDLPAAETLTISLAGSQSGGIYSGPVTVTASSSTGATLTAVVDSVGPTNYDDPIVVFSPGVHQITVTSSTGLVEQRSFIISGPACTIIGTDGPDILVGTDGDDVICALDGADTISGGGGNDIIFAGRGADIVNGGAGADMIDGGEGPDELNGGAGDDMIVGGDGPDELNGGSGDDELDGGSGDDDMNGGSGTDRCVGTKGNGNGKGRSGDTFKSCEE